MLVLQKKLDKISKQKLHVHLDEELLKALPPKRNLVCLCFGEFSLTVLGFWKCLLGVEAHLEISLFNF